MEKSYTSKKVKHWKNMKLGLISESMAVGILAGLVVVFYRIMLDKSLKLSHMIYSKIGENILLLIPWTIILIMCGVLLGIMTKKNPMIKGSGIPQIQGVILRKLHMNGIRVVIEKLLGGIIAIGAGLSLGREGPSVQIGGAVGQSFSRFLGRGRLEEKYLVTSGASAGLSAAFNAPIAGVMFALEEIHKNFSPLILISAMTSSLTADFISRNFFGLKPVFRLEKIVMVKLEYYPYLIILGIILGFLGKLFNNGLLKSQKIYKDMIFLKDEFKPVIPMFMAILFGLFIPLVLGGGHDLIEEVLSGHIILSTIFILFLAKFIFTLASFGSGVPGGIFLPLLSLGALIGMGYGMVCSKFFGMDANYIRSLGVLAMAGYFAATVKSPVTGSILIAEMTGSLEGFLATGLVALVSYITTDLIGNRPIYESLLEGILAGEKIEEKNESSEEKVIFEFIVPIDSHIDGKKIKDLNMSVKFLILAIKRGTEEVIPQGESMIKGGDVIVVMADSSLAYLVKEEFLDILKEKES